MMSDMRAPVDLIIHVSKKMSPTIHHHSSIHCTTDGGTTSLATRAATATMVLLTTMGIRQGGLKNGVTTTISPTKGGKGVFPVVKGFGRHRRPSMTSFLYTMEVRGDDDEDNDDDDPWKPCCNQLDQWKEY